MTYPEQLKQMSNEEFADFLIYKLPHVPINTDELKAEILSRMEQPSPEHSNLNQQLFDYFKQEHGIMLMDGDYNEIKNILQPSQEQGKEWLKEIDAVEEHCRQEHLKEALEEIQEKSQTACFQSNPHSYIKPMGEILKIATKALNQK